MPAMNETLRLLKRFALLSLLCLCVIGMFCGGAMVDENSRQLTLGETGTQVGLRQDRQTVTFYKAAETPTALADFPSADSLLSVLRLAPAPLGNFIALGGEIAGAVTPQHP